MAGRALSPLDATFLYMESERAPMHIGSVGVFEGGPLTDRSGRLRIADIRRHVEQRLDLIPDLRRRAWAGRLGHLPPVWVDDDDFDIEHHVRAAALPSPGGPAELAELSARIFEVLLDRSRPLWELWFVEGLEAGRVALIEKIHHSLADGLAGVRVATVVLDIEPHPPAPPSVPQPWHAEPPPSPPAVLVHDLQRLGASPLHAARDVAQAVAHPVHAAHQVADVAGAVGSLATARTVAPRSPLNTPIGRGRRLRFTGRRLDELRAVGHHFGTTVNDVVLSAVGGGLRALLISRGEPVADHQLQVLVPVGTGGSTGTGLGNQVSALLVRVPVGIPDPVERLRHVAASTAECKAHHQAVGTHAFLSLLGVLPRAALEAVAHTVAHQPFVNLVVTNVPGPQFPLYMLGARMLEVYPIVPLGGNLSIGFAALSYDGTVGIGILADRDTCPDVDVVVEGLAASFTGLARAARVA